MPAQKLTEALIRRLTSAQTFSRGEEYYIAGAVSDLTLRGNSLRAQVEGSRYEPYRVLVEVDDGGVIGVRCTCPYDLGGYCKHVVAVLLAYVRQPGCVAERCSVDELLTGLRRDELMDLLTQLLSAHPHLTDWVEAQLAVKTTSGSSKASAKPRRRSRPIDPAPFRRQAESILGGLGRIRPSDAYWATSGTVDEIRKLLKQAQPFIEAGDGRNALLILEAVTEVYVDRWTDFDDSDGELGELFSDLGLLFSEAILSVDLTQEERSEWAEKLTNWQRNVEGYGIDEGFGIAIAAAAQGWDYAPLQSAMQGQITEKGGWEGEVPWYADELAVVRLNVLERLGKTTEYLNLAEAEGQTDKYVTMLVKLGRSQEAIEYGLKYLATPDEMLTLATSLREHGLAVEALGVGEHGLMLEGETRHLGRWVRDLASGLEQPEIALKAARIVFERALSLEDYQAVQAISGAEWATIKKQLLNVLARSGHASGKIDVYLYEGMVHEAVQAVDQNSYVGYDTLERVVDAACQSHPDWVISQCKKQAEPIMDSGKSKYYHHAARWLAKVRQAYKTSDREREWSKYLEGLIGKHARKSSLRAHLEALRK
ncbi:MAG TPA: SWIM zinc finger family protein [Pyrinomonadaceae bacterium]|nr:SWIM zinc finger family protein [Pyrinomonadaceae bacterium]